MRQVMIALLVLALLFVGGSYLLDPHVEVSRSIVVAAPASTIHAWVDDLRQWPQWSPFDEQDETRVYELGAVTSGVGAQRSWTSTDSLSGTQTIVESDPGKGVVMELRLEGVEAPASVAITFEPVDGGTRVTWTDRFDVGDNPFYRWMTLRADDLVGAAFESGLRKLAHLAEQGPPPAGA